MSTPLPPEATPEFLNEAFRIWDGAPGATRSEVLHAHLQKHGLDAHYKAFDEAFFGVTGAGYSFLQKLPEGTRSSEALWAEHDAEIRRWSPWLDDDNFGRACHQSRYYAWHDGLVKS
jgi:hypothetical protein